MDMFPQEKPNLHEGMIRVMMQEKTNGPNKPHWVTKEEFQRLLSVHPEQKSFNPKYPVGYFGFTHDLEPRQTLTDAENLRYPPMPVEEIRGFIAQNKWVFAKTMAFLPHWYVINGSVTSDFQLYRFMAHIRRCGVARPFGERMILYFDLDGYKYWSMGYPIDPPPHIEGDGIINKAKLTQKDMMLTGED